MLIANTNQHQLQYEKLCSIAIQIPIVIFGFQEGQLKMETIKAGPFNTTFSNNFIIEYYSVPKTVFTSCVLQYAF